MANSTHGPSPGERKRQLVARHGGKAYGNSPGQTHPPPPLQAQAPSRENAPSPRHYRSWHHVDAPPDPQTPRQDAPSPMPEQHDLKQDQHQDRPYVSRPQPQQPRSRPHGQHQNGKHQCVYDYQRASKQILSKIYIGHLQVRGTLHFNKYSLQQDRMSNTHIYKNEGHFLQSMMTARVITTI